MEKCSQPAEILTPTATSTFFVVKRLASQPVVRQHSRPKNNPVSGFLYAVITILMMEREEKIGQYCGRSGFFLLLLLPGN